MRSEAEIKKRKRKCEMKIRALKRMKKDKSYNKLFLTAGDVDRRIKEYNHEAHALEWVYDSDE